MKAGGTTRAVDMAHHASYLFAFLLIQKVRMRLKNSDASMVVTAAVQTVGSGIAEVQVLTKV